MISISDFPLRQTFRQEIPRCCHVYEGQAVPPRIKSDNWILTPGEHKTPTVTSAVQAYTVHTHSRGKPQGHVRETEGWAWKQTEASLRREWLLSSNRRVSVHWQASWYIENHLSQGIISGIQALRAATNTKFLTLIDLCTSWVRSLKNHLSASVVLSEWALSSEWQSCFKYDKTILQNWTLTRTRKQSKFLKPGSLCCQGKLVKNFEDAGCHSIVNVYYRRSTYCRNNARKQKCTTKSFFQSQSEWSRPKVMFRILINGEHRKIKS